MSCFVAVLVALIFAMITVKSVRNYVLSFFFSFLYSRATLAEVFGIRFEDDLSWKTNRRESRIFMNGFFMWLFTKFTGTELILSDEIRKHFMRVQMQSAGNIDMTHYLKKLDGQTMTISEFEHFLSETILEETNRVFGIVDSAKEKILKEKVRILRSIVNSLTGNPWRGIKLMLVNFADVIEISRILKSVPEHLRLLLFVPQLTLINNFSKMIVRMSGDMSSIQTSDFLTAVSKFFVIETNGQLVFVHRHKDPNNGPTNRAFGPMGLQCPGNIYTFKFLDSILGFLQTLKIQVHGVAKLSGTRFSSIQNKDNVSFTFVKSS